MWLILKKMKVLNRVIYNLQLYLHVYIKSTSSNDAWWVMTRRGLCGNQLKFHREEQWLCLVSLYHGSYLAKCTQGTSNIYCVNKYTVQCVTPRCIFIAANIVYNLRSLWLVKEFFSLHQPYLLVPELQFY